MTKVLASMLTDSDDFYRELAGVGYRLLVLLCVFYLLIIGVAIVMYVMESWGCYTIAKRRGIHKPWLSWIPVANLWIFGSISDQYQYVTKGKVHNRRKSLLGLTVGMYVLLIAYLVVAVMFIAKVFGGALNGIEPQLSETFGLMVGFWGLWLVALILSIVLAVFRYMTYYDLFRSCEPDNAVMYLVLGLFFSFLLPIFVFLSRKKDLGMPPRKPKPEQPVEALLGASEQTEE